MNPLVSVIIPVRDAMAVLPPQLRALGRQRQAPAFVVLLADNGRNGDLLALAAEHAPGLPVQVVDATAEAGTAYARNVGISCATTDKLLFCDADDVVGPTWVRDGAATLDDVPVFSGGAVPFVAKDLDRPLDDVWAQLAAELPSYLDDADDMPEGSYPVLLGCSFGMQREFAQYLGGFDRAFGSQAEDNDLAFRAQRAYGSLPRAGYVTVAYRLRPAAESSMRRAFDSGFRHAEMCARHRAWALSPTFQGHWIVRPIKEVLRRSELRSPASDVVARVAGLIAGRALFAVGPTPRPRLGVNRTR